MAHAAQLLGDTYTLVITNVPYLGPWETVGTAERFLPIPPSRREGRHRHRFRLAFFRWLGKHGTQAAVTPQNWLFLTTYRKLRERLLNDRTWNLVARLGPGAFETITGHVVNVALNILSADSPQPDWQMAGIDVSAPRSQRPIKPAEKADLLVAGASPRPVHQAAQLRNPDSVVLIRPIGGRALLQRIAHGHQGTSSRDDECFRRKVWELSSDMFHDWTFLQSTVTETTCFGGRQHVLNWGDQNHVFNAAKDYVYRGKGVWEKSGVAVSQIGLLPVTYYTGETFDTNTCVLGPLSSTILPAVWCFCSSPEYCHTVREIDHGLKVTGATLVKVPFDLERWKKVGIERYPNGLPEPYSDDPTQWIFHGDPCGSVVWDEEGKWTARGPLRIDDTVLQVAVARLLGYRWPAELDSEMRLAKEQQELVEYCAEFAGFADADGIVCLSPTRGEATAADRVRRLLAAAYADEWSPATEHALLAATSAKPPASLEDWLRDRFFQEHCKLFHNRPFIWHIWDGRKDGFHTLVNYHRLAGPGGEGRRTLETGHVLLSQRLDYPAAAGPARGSRGG